MADIWQHRKYLLEATVIPLFLDVLSVYAMSTGTCGCVPESEQQFIVHGCLCSLSGTHTRTITIVAILLCTSVCGHEVGHDVRETLHKRPFTILNQLTPYRFITYKYILPLNTDHHKHVISYAMPVTSTFVIQVLILQIVICNVKVVGYWKTFGVNSTFMFLSALPLLKFRRSTGRPRPLCTVVCRCGHVYLIHEFMQRWTLNITLFCD